MPLPRSVGRFNRRVTNPLARLVAGWLPPFAIVGHVGRVSGRSYRTPVWAFRTRDGLVVALTYGSRTDWVANAVAAGDVGVARRGATRRYVDPRLVRGREGMRLMPAVVRPALHALGVDEFLLLIAA